MMMRKTLALYIILLVLVTMLKPTDVGMGQSPVEFSAAKWSPDGKFIAASGGYGTVRVWNADMEHQFDLIENDRQFVAVLDWSPDSSRLAAGGGDGTIWVWHIQNVESPPIHQPGDLLATLVKHQSAVHGMDWSPDGSKLVSVTHGRETDPYTIVLWDMESYTTIQATRFGNNSDVVWSPDGSELLVSGEAGVIVFPYADFVNLGSEGIRTSRIRLTNTATRSVAWQTNGQDSLIAFSNRNGITVVDADNYQIMNVVEVGLYHSAIHFSHNLQSLASVDEEGRTVEIRAVATGALLKSVTLYKDSLTTAVDWSADDSYLVYADIDTVHIIAAPLVGDIQ